MRLITSVIKICAIILLIGIGETSCRKELPQVYDAGNKPVNTYGELFDQFWNMMNSRYQFWDKDTTDWDAMYTRYKPVFDKLDINNEDDQRQSVQYFRQMLSGTLDGHMDVGFYPPAIADSFIYTRLDQNVATILHEQNINPGLLPGEQQRTSDYWAFTYYSIDAANYLDPDNISGTYSDPVYGDVNLLEGTINKNILYFGFDAEYLTAALQNSGTNILKSAYNSFSEVLKNNPDIKGVIVDMRGSQGGFGNDATILASSMIDKPLFRGTVRYKNGPGRLDYTPWMPTYINPAQGAKAIKVPLIILTDLLTYSAAEYITTALHAIPGAVTVGTTTRGGVTGNTGFDNMQGKGYTLFTTNYLGSFMDIILSPCAYKYIDGSETIWGLKPDYEVPFDTVAINEGRDLQLEKALSLIH